MGNEGDHDLSRASSSDHHLLNNIFNPPNNNNNNISQHLQNPNNPNSNSNLHNMINNNHQNPNSSLPPNPNLVYDPPLGFYNSLNPNASEFYNHHHHHHHQLMSNQNQNQNQNQNYQILSSSSNMGSSSNGHDHDHHQALEAAFNRLNLVQQESSIPVGPAFGAIARPPPPLTNAAAGQEYYNYLLYLQDIHKKRIESAVKGQHYGYNMSNGSANVVGSGSNGNYGMLGNGNSDFLGIQSFLGAGGGRSQLGSSEIQLLNPNPNPNFPIFNNVMRPGFGRINNNNNKYNSNSNSNINMNMINGSTSSSSSPRRGDLGSRRGRSMNRANNNSDHSSSSILGSSSSSIFNNSRSRPSYTSLEELKGRIGFAAKEQDGCRFLQKKLEEGNGDEVELIFSEMVDCLQDLIVDQFGNYLIQKLFEVCNEEQVTKILYSPAVSNEKKLLAICTNDHGTRAIQKLLEYITTVEQKSIIFSTLSRIGLPLMKDQKGNHVIQQCLRLFAPADVKYILHQVAENCLDLALDRQGCCVLQLCLSQARGEYLDRLLSEIAANALALSVNCFGNYVLQFVLELEIPEATASVVSQLYGNYVHLATNKCASNVVEKCLQEAKEDQCTLIIHELLSSPSFLNVCQDSYGNYVVQTALRVSKGEVHKCLANHIVKVLFPFLQSHPHGKNVLQEAKPSKHSRGGYNKRK